MDGRGGVRKKHHSKVRTGCITCKNRRVKCDETKPACHRCKKAGRQCEGYDNFYSWTVSPTDGSSEELRSTQFYHERIVSTVSGLFDGTFWKDLVTQAAVSEPAVKHALIALSSMFESTQNQSSSQLQYLAWQQCNKSIQILLHQQRPSKSVILVASAIFTHLELFQGHLSSAMAHLRSAFQILEEESESNDPRLVKLFESIVTDHILICSPYVRPPAENWLFGKDEDFKMPQLLKTPQQTMQALFHIISRRRFSASREELEEMAAEERDAIEDWVSRIDTTGMSDDFRLATLAIKAVGLVATPVFHGNTANDQLVFDEYTPQFEQALQTCHLVYTHELDRWKSGKSTQWSKYRPLHATLAAIMLISRDPNIRRGAIDLSRKIYGRQPNRYGEGPSIADTSEFVMLVEEAGAEKQPVTKASDIPITARVRLAANPNQEENSGSLHFIRYPFNEEGPYEEAILPSKPASPYNFDPDIHSDEPNTGWNQLTTVRLVQFYSALYRSIFKAFIHDPTTNLRNLMVRATGFGVDQLIGLESTPQAEKVPYNKASPSASSNSSR